MTTIVTITTTITSTTITIMIMIITIIVIISKELGQQFVLRCHKKSWHFCVCMSTKPTSRTNTEK